eukprot:jgi/Picre1/31518/NNA_006870.t1
MFGKMHGSSKKKTPAKAEEGHGRGTVRKLFPFSPSRIPKSAHGVKSPSRQQSTQKSGAMRCVVQEHEGELIPASRGKVVVRIRPTSQKDRRAGAVESREGTIHLQSGLGERYSFAFDTVLDEKMSQTDVYESAGNSVIENCLKGFHGCLLAYGQTGSGKTYSMMGVPERASVVRSRDDPDRGVIQRSFEDLFQKMERRRQEKACEGGSMRYKVVCSFIEIYNESITDLTYPEGVGLSIRDDPVKGVYVEGVQQHAVSSVEDVEELLCLGMSNRKVAETLANDRSSRSHSVFTATVEQTIEEPGHVAPVILRSRLHLVDLAGSERQKASGAAGERLREASNINKSLSALGHVIMSLVDLQQGKQRHIPYRDSKLTYLLQDALGGTSKTEEAVEEDGSRKALVAALRREEDMCRKVASIQEELVLLQELVDAKEADLQRTKMMLRLKESRITRSQATHAESHKVAALQEEIILLKQKVEAHPEVKKFALENIRLRRHIEDHAQDHEASPAMVPEEEFQQLRKELLAMSTVAEQAMEEVQTLRAEASAAKEVLRTAEKKMREPLSPSPTRIAHVENAGRIAELEMQLDNLQMLADKNSAQQREYERLCTHAAELDAVVETLTIRCSQLRRERDDWCDSYPLILQTLVEGWDERATLLKTINDMQESFAREKDVHTSQHEKAKQRVEEALKTASLLNKELQLKDTRIGELQESIDMLVSENQTLQNRMLTAESDAQRITQEYEERGEMLAETRTALEASRTQVIEQTRLIEETSMKLQELQTAYDCMNQTSKAREKEVYSLQAALAAADMDAQMAQAKLKEKSRQISELDESETSLRGTLIELQKKMEESQKSMDSEIRELTQDLEASQLHIQTLRRSWRHPNIKARAQDHVESVEGTGPLGKEARARTLSQKLQDAEDTILHLTQEVASLKTQIKSRDETLATVRNQMAMEVTDAAQQVQELVAAQARAEDLERQLAKIRRQRGSHA